MKPTLYGFPPSTYTQTALMTAAEAGVDVELGPLEFKKASHLALHPYGKMPAFEHDGVRLFETLAIVTYLDRVFGGSKLTPSDPVAHARMLQWVSVAIDYAYEDLVNGMHSDAPSTEAITAACEQLKLIDAGLADGEFLAGSSFSLADLFLYPMIEYASRRMDEGVWSGLPEVRRWRAAVAARPSVRARKAQA
ncbi:MAG: glutathione S-transferase family protein [Polyangiaceae bacterium]